MDILVPVLLLFPFIGVKRSDGCQNYLSESQTSSINGIFVVMIIIRHFLQYITIGKYDFFLSRISAYLGQLIVVSFLLFSGYAFVKQFQSKQDRYLQKIPRKILSLWLIFLFTVLSFIIVGLAVGEKYDVKTIALAIVGMASVGNSTWYIFAIICCWLFSWIGFKQSRLNPNIVVLGLVLLYMILISKIKEAVFYNTIIAYPIGFIFAHYENKLYPFFHRYYWFILPAVCGVLVVGVKLYTWFWFYELWVLAFSLLLVMFSMKLQLNNKVLTVLSKYSLEVYLVQRIPMILLKNLISVNILYFGAVLILTLLLSVLWKLVFRGINHILSYHKA